MRQAPCGTVIGEKDYTVHIAPHSLLKLRSDRARFIRNKLTGYSVPVHHEGQVLLSPPSVWPAGGGVPKHILDKCWGALYLKKNSLELCALREGVTVNKKPVVTRPMDRDGPPHYLRKQLGTPDVWNVETIALFALYEDAAQRTYGICAFFRALIFVYG